MKVRTSNVIITKSMVAMEKLFFAKHKLKSFKGLLDDLSDKDLADSFINSPLRNDGLLHFELNFTSNKQKGGYVIKAKFLESSKLLEIFMLENDPMARMLANKEREISKLSSNLKVPENIMSRGSASIAFKDKLDLINRYFVAFGDSDDTTEWAGPFCVDLVQATLSNDSSNNRIIEVTFVPKDNNFRSWSRKFGEQLGYTDDLSMMSNFVTTKTFHYGVGRADSINLSGKKEGVPKTDLEYSLDYRIRKILKQYIGGWSNDAGNAVVVLPQRFGKFTFPKLQGFSKFRTLKIDQRSTNLKDFEDRLSLAELGIYTSILEQSQTSKTTTAKEDYLAENDFQPKQIPIEEQAKKETSTDESQKIREERIREFEEELENERSELTASRQQEYTQTIQNINDQEAQENAQLQFELTTPGVEGLGVRIRRLLQDPLIDPTIKDELRDATIGGIPTPAPARISQILTQFTVTEPFQQQREFEEERRDRELEAMNSSIDEDLKEGSPARQKLEKEIESDILRSKNKDKNVSSKSSAKNSQHGSIDDVKSQIKSPNPSVDKLNKISSMGNIDSNLDLVRETTGPLAGSALMFEMGIEQKNEPPQLQYDGFSPIVSPLIKFASALRSKDPRAGERDGVYDFYEETDVRILKLWAKYGIIRDPTSPAYVFGDMAQIKYLLYGDFANQARDRYACYTVFNPEALNDNGGVRPGSLMFAPGDPGSADAESARREYLKDFAKAFPNDDGDLVFIHNEKNGNVIRLNYNIDSYYAALLNMPVRPLADKSRIGSSRAQLFKDETAKVLGPSVLAAMSKYKEDDSFEQFYTNVQKSGSKKNAELAFALSKKDAIVDDRSVNTAPLLLMMFLYLNSDIASAAARDLSDNAFEVPPADIGKYYSSVLKMMERLLVRCKVRTLPMFQAKSYLHRKCILQGTTNSPVGFTRELRKPAPYNGTYTIVGYKHVISPTQSYSEFDIVRGAANQAMTTGQTVKEFICRSLTSYLQGVFDETGFDDFRFREQEASRKGESGRDAFFKQPLYPDGVLQGILNVSAKVREDGFDYGELMKALKTLGCTPKSTLAPGESSLRDIRELRRSRRR